jgi:hypothetical protein
MRRRRRVYRRRLRRFRGFRRVPVRGRRNRRMFRRAARKVHRRNLRGRIARGGYSI